MSLAAPFRPRLLAAVCCVAAASAQAQGAAPQPFDLPAQSLNASLIRIASDSGVRVSVDAELVRGLSAPAVRGSFTPEAALQQALAGSGLELVRTGSGVLTVRRGSATPTASGPVAGAMTLLAVQVSADNDRSGTTEGTGSYTTRRTSAATGLSLSLRETPQSVTVVTQQRIEDQRLQSLTEVLAATTGISASQNDGNRMTYFSRGFSINNFQYDGIPTAATANWYAGETELDAALYDRVEVVRGATGLLTGAGNPSASINLVRKHADSKVLAGEVSLGAGSWDNYRAQVDVSTPLTADGRIRGRVVAAYQDKHSYVNLSSVKKQVFYAVVDADLTPDTRLSVGADYQDNDPKGSAWGGFPLWYSDGSRTDWGRSTTTGTNWSYWASRTQTAFATLEHRFDNQWKANVGFTHSKQSLDTRLLYLYGWPDRTTGLGMNAVASIYKGQREQDSLNAQLSGPFELLGRKHEATFGFLGSEQKYQYDYRQGTSLATIVYTPGWDGSFPEPAWAPNRTLEQGRTTQLGLYSAGRFTLTDDTRLIVGGRYSSWKDKTATTERDHRKFIPYAGLTYDFSRESTVYASYTSIFNPQDARDRAGSYLDPIVGKSYELGIKNSRDGGKLNSSLAIFRIQQDNLAQADVGYLTPGGIDQAYYGAKGVRSTGFEVDVSGEVARGWNLFSGLTHYTAEDATNTPVATNQPRTLLRLFSTYKLPGEGGKLTVGGGVNWQSNNYSTAYGPNGPERVSQGAYAIVGLMARYQFDPKLSLQVNLNNAFDKKYYSQIGYYSAGAWGAPRNLMATLNYKF